MATTSTSSDLAQLEEGQVVV